jgi:hypothetical protein
LIRAEATGDALLSAQAEEAIVHEPQIRAVSR